MAWLVVSGVLACGPRGDVSVRVFPCAGREHGGWQYTGMIGRASVPRLLEIAGERMQADEGVLLGGLTYYEQRAAEQNRNTGEWIAYYSRRGPEARQAGATP